MVTVITITITIMVMDIVTAMIMATVTAMTTVTVIVNYRSLDLFQKRTTVPVVTIPPRLLRLPVITITIMTIPP